MSTFYTLGDIKETFGFALPGEFVVDTLGIACDEKDKRSMRFARAKVLDIARKTAEHLMSLDEEDVVHAEKAPSKARAQPASKSSVLDDL